MNRRTGRQRYPKPGYVAPGVLTHRRASAVGQFDRRVIPAGNLERAYRARAAQQRAFADCRHPQNQDQCRQRRAGQSADDRICAKRGGAVHDGKHGRKPAGRQEFYPQIGRAVQIRLNTRVPLVPPKPNEFDIACRMVIWREVLGT